MDNPELTGAIDSPTPRIAGMDGNVLAEYIALRATEKRVVLDSGCVTVISGA
jgi:hypothetical protein